MHYIKWPLLYILLFLINKHSFAQQQNIQLTPTIRTDVVDTLSAALLAKYIYPDTAVKMSSYIKKRLKNGVYNALDKPDDFAQALNQDLNVVYRDLHMRIYYDSGFEKAMRVKSYMDRVTRQMSYSQMAKQKNYGFQKVEILDGNVGYISITQFYAVDEQSIAVVKNVFTFLKNTSALIIDVRDDPGGEPDMVKYIGSYFFKEKTHLGDYYDRRTKINQYWTEPSSASVLFSSVPIYVLINNHTGSAAEEFAYDLQSLHRAKIVGQYSAGAAHWTSPNSISNGFIANIPFKKAINPITRTNWEKTGVKPDINSESALSTALLTAYDNQVSTSKDTVVISSAKWFRAAVSSKIYPYIMTMALLKTFTGNYKGRLITFERGRLYFTDNNGYKIDLIPLSQTIFIFSNNDHHLNFHKDNAGKVDEMDFISQDGHIEKFGLKN